MNIPKQLLMNSNTQLYSFILLGFLLAFIWPVNILYTFLLTRAYIRDKTNLFKSFYEETIEQGKYTINLIKLAVDKLNKKSGQSRKDNMQKKELSKKAINQDNMSEKTSNRDVNDKESIRKRNIDNKDLDSDIDTI